MDKNKDNGVSPVIATVLLIALSIVLISLVSLSIMSAVGSFTPVETKVVGFTVSVNATANTALVTPVSGNDLPFMESYRVYTNNGHWDKPDAGNLTIPDFNSTVTYVNIVGNFSDNVTTLVFSGKVVIEGGVVVVEPTHGGYYMVGSDGYHNVDEFIASLNDWYDTYYPEAIGDAAEVDGNGINFINNLPIIIGDEPITISDDNIGNLHETFRIIISGDGNFIRAPGYELALFVIENKKVKIELGTLVLDGMGLPATHPALEITETSKLSIENGGHLLVKNNINSNGNGGGINNEGTIDVNTAGSLEATGNTAHNGGGIYNTGTFTKNKNGDVSITYNYAVNNGGGVYNAGSFPSSGVDYSSNTADGSGDDIYP
jgi:hypothetical protein